MDIARLLRWVAILPVSLITATLCCIALLIIVLIGDLFSGQLWLYLKHPEIIPLDHFFLSFALWAAFGWTFVRTGTEIAPLYKRIIAFVLFAIVAIVFGFLMIFSLITTNISDSWRILADSTACIIASGVTAFLAEETD